MLKITRCNDRYLLASDCPVLHVDPAIHIHLSKKELKHLVRTGLKAIFAKRRIGPCRYCAPLGAD